MTRCSCIGTNSGKAQEVSQITDAAGRTTTYSYSGGMLARITDFSRRTMDFAYDGSFDRVLPASVYKSF